MNYKDCFASIRHQGNAHKKRPRIVTDTSRYKRTELVQKKNKYHALDMRIKSLMKKYENDPEILEDLKNKIGAYLINITVARDVHSKNLERKHTKEFINYLSKMEKEI